MGKAGGTGQGQGEGHGKGKGESNVAIGTGVAVAFTVIFCIIGVPMFFAGIAFVAMQIFVTAGIALLVISLLMLVGGIVLIVLICTGVVGKNNKTGTTTNTTVIISSNNPAAQTGPMAPAYRQTSQPRAQQHYHGNPNSGYGAQQPPGSYPPSGESEQHPRY